MSTFAKFAVVMLLALGTNPATSEELAKPTKKTEPVGPVFRVKGGNCSRSIREIGVFKNAREACWAADTLEKKPRHLEITYGDKGQYTLFTPAPQYHVYFRACKSFQLVLTTNDAKKAAAKKEELKSTLGSVWIVKVFAEKK